MKHLLLIGGGGYVGTVIAYSLLQKGYKITVLDNLIYDHAFATEPFLGDPSFRFVKGDLGNSNDLASAFDATVTDVVILGGLVGDPITKKYPQGSEQINSTGIRNCIDFFDDKHIGKLVFISTCSNYGLIPENETADENFELSPLSLYAKAKVAAEQYLMEKKGKTHYAGVVLRFATAFGLSPRMRFDLSVNEFTRDLFLGSELLVFDEHTWRPYCHVKDFARLIDLVVNAENNQVDFQVFNAGGDQNNFTKKMIVDAILEELPQAKVSYGANGTDPRNYKVSFQKVKSVLGFEPQYSVVDGINELIGVMKSGFYADVENRNRYGNYHIEQFENEVPANH